MDKCSGAITAASPLLCQTTPVGFNQTAVKTAVEENGSGAGGTPEPADRRDARPKRAASGSPEQSFRRPRAVLCGSYRRGIPSLVRAYEELSAAGLRVLSPSGLDFAAAVDGPGLQQAELADAPETPEALRLDCIRAADLVWLHAPDGYVDLSGALEVGFANAAGVPVYAAEMPSNVAVRSLVTVSPLDQAIAQANTRKEGNARASALPPQAHPSVVARDHEHAHRSEHDIMRLITEEIGDLARQNPGQRLRPSRRS